MKDEPSYVCLLRLNYQVGVMNFGLRSEGFSEQAQLEVCDLVRGSWRELGLVDASIAMTICPPPGRTGVPMSWEPELEPHEMRYFGAWNDLDPFRAQVFRDQGAVGGEGVSVTEFGDGRIRVGVSEPIDQVTTRHVRNVVRALEPFVADVSAWPRVWKRRSQADDRRDIYLFFGRRQNEGDVARLAGE